MSADALLSRLDKVRRTGPGRWLACCPAHDDRSPSLSVREMDDGFVMVKCFGQDCSIFDICAATGVDIAEMFPPKPPRAEGYKPERRRFFPADVFDIALREATVAAVIACDMHKGKAIADADHARLLTACGRLNTIAEAAYGK